MSDKLMETEIGGEQTQYEGEHTDVDAPKKSSGQLGASESQSDQTTSATSAADTVSDEQSAARGAKTAENIRYGQGISEGGMGGQTTAGTAGTGSGNDEGYGRVEDTQGVDEGGAGRGSQGYGGSADQDKTIGG